MTIFSTRTTQVIFATALLCLTFGTAAAQTAATPIASAADKFLATLDAKQRQSVLFAFDDDKQRARWSNFPTSFVARGGLSLKELNPTQHAAAMALVASALSPRGLEKVEQIMQGDEVNKINEQNNPTFGKGGPPSGKGRPPSVNGGPPPGNDNPPIGKGPPPFDKNNPIFGKDLYYISILGTPSEKDPWMLQFGGHHLALNITIAGERGVLTPSLTGAQPALYTLDGKTVRPLGQESDKAIALLTAFDDKQRKQAILSYTLADLVLGPGQDGKTIVPEGLKASAMNAQQRAMLLDLIQQWAGIINVNAAAARMAELKADLNETWFAWSGPTTVKAGSNITAYYRIQGPHLVIEYAPQTLGGDPALHVHTMYRDPANDYGKKLSAK